jgi:hypothetical protein
MSSPIPVGAPNTYYAAFHRWLAENPKATGDALAERIATFDEHFTIYTCLRTKALDELPERLDKAIAPFLVREKLVPAGRLPVIHPAGEPIVDARAFLERLAQANEVDAAPVADFFKWVEKDLFTFVRLHKRAGRSARTLCGLSIYAPSTEAEARRYKHLDLYSGARLAELWQKVLAGAAAGSDPNGGGGGGPVPGTTPPPKRQPRGY